MTATTTDGRPILRWAHDPGDWQPEKTARSNSAEPFRDDGYLYVLTRIPSPAKITAEESGEITPGESGPNVWFSGTRDGDHLKLRVFGRISAGEEITNLEQLFAGASSAAVTVTDCVGGDACGIQALCKLLRDVGESSVRCRVNGFCNSAATWIPCFAGRVSADPGASFAFHGPRSTFSRAADMPSVLEDLDRVCAMMTAVLKRRIVADPEQYLTPESQYLTAEQARAIGLVDVVY